MAKLTLIVSFETNEDYDNAVHENQLRLKMDTGLKASAEQLGQQIGQQVSRLLNGLRYVVNYSVAVRVMAELGEYDPRRELREQEGQQAVPSPVNDTPSEKRRLG